MHSIIAAGVISTMVTLTPPVKELSPVRIQELVKKLEEPTRLWLDGKGGPPDYPRPTRAFRYPGDCHDLGFAGPAVIPMLINLFDDKSNHTQVRTNAIITLTRHLAGMLRVPDPRVIAAVRAAIADKDPAVREGVLSSLCERGVNNNRGIPNSLSPFVSALPRSALRDLLPHVVKATADNDPQVSDAALRAMFSLGEPGVGIEELMAALERKEPTVRAAALFALGELGRDDPRVFPLMLGYLDNRGEPTYSSAVWAVGRYGPKAKAAVPKLIEGLKDSRVKEEFPWILVKTLGEIGPDANAAVPTLLELHHHGSYSALLHLFSALDQIDPMTAKNARADQRAKEEAYWQSVERLNPKLENSPFPPPGPPVRPKP